MNEFHKFASTELEYLDKIFDYELCIQKVKQKNIKFTANDKLYSIMSKVRF